MAFKTTACSQLTDGAEFSMIPRAVRVVFPHESAAKAVLASSESSSPA